MPQIIEDKKKIDKYSPWRFSTAPMMEWTDRHCRSFHRAFSRHALLYTEMVTTGAIIHGPRARLLAFDASEQPVAVQLGGSVPQDLATSARICTDFGYAEINLNVGCPSDRVQNGCFGAALMREPQLVGECVAAMKAVSDLPITVKCRLGVDDQDVEEALDQLADACVAAGVDALIVHARKAWLKGLSPKENRDIPPLDYARVRRLKARLPHLPIAVNGGIKTYEEMQILLKPDGDLPALDGVMIGREAYQNPMLLLHVDQHLFGAEASPDVHEALAQFEPYITQKLEEGVPLHAITRHMLGLFPAQYGARAFRRHLATEALKPKAGLEVLREAVNFVKNRPPLADAA